MTRAIALLRRRSPCAAAAAAAATAAATAAAAARARGDDGGDDEREARFGMTHARVTGSIKAKCNNPSAVISHPSKTIEQSNRDLIKMTLARPKNNQK